MNALVQSFSTYLTLANVNVKNVYIFRLIKILPCYAVYYSITSPDVLGFCRAFVSVLVSRYVGR